MCFKINRNTVQLAYSSARQLEHPTTVSSEFSFFCSVRFLKKRYPEKISISCESSIEQMSSVLDVNFDGQQKTIWHPSDN